jgi:hypothetical protein
MIPAVSLRLLVAFPFALIGAGAASAAVRAKFEPPDGRILLIVGQDVETINRYVEGTGLPPGGVMSYTSVQRLDGLDAPADHGAGPVHASELLERYPHSVLQLGLYMVDALDGIAAGEYDVQLERLARWLARIRRPVYLRVGYEFDAPPNRYEPKAYQRAFRHVVELLRTQGVENVAYVWHSYAAKTARPVDAWYPGDAFVDWVGISYFGQVPDYPEAVMAFAKAHGKPVMIAEASPAGVGTKYDWLSWQSWFVDFFRFVKEHRIPVISYINTDWDSQRMWEGQGWEDARVEANSSVKAAWLDEVTRPAYIHATPDLPSLLAQ